MKEYSNEFLENPFSTVYEFWYTSRQNHSYLATIKYTGYRNNWELSVYTYPVPICRLYFDTKEQAASYLVDMNIKRDILNAARSK